MSLAPTGTYKCRDLRGGLPRPSYRGHSDGRAASSRLLEVGETPWTVLPSAPANAPWLFARWPLSPPCGVPQRRRQTNAVVVRGGVLCLFPLLHKRRGLTYFGVGAALLQRS